MARTPGHPGRDHAHRGSASPLDGEVPEHLGLTFSPIPGYIFDLVVAGSGPAGLAAAVYGATEGLRTVSVDRDDLAVHSAVFVGVVPGEV
jgi:hypothetical protein